MANDPVTSPPMTPSGKTNRVFVVERFPIFRDGLCAAISANKNFTLIGQSGYAPEAMAAIERDQPDLLTMCLQLGSTDGIEFIKQLRCIAPAMRILVVSSLDENIWALRALNAGAEGYIMKFANAKAVVDALVEVAGGGTWLSPHMTAQVVRRACGKQKASESSMMLTLSDREMHVFQMIGSGLGTRQIAAELHLSVKTIETYRANIRLKLGLKNAAETVEHARTWIDRNAGESEERQHMAS